MAHSEDLAHATLASSEALLHMHTILNLCSSIAGLEILSSSQCLHVLHVIATTFTIVLIFGARSNSSLDDRRRRVEDCWNTGIEESRS